MESDSPNRAVSPQQYLGKSEASIDRGSPNIQDRIIEALTRSSISGDGFKYRLENLKPAEHPQITHTAAAAYYWNLMIQRDQVDLNYHSTQHLAATPQRYLGMNDPQ